MSALRLIFALCAFTLLAAPVGAQQSIKVVASFTVLADMATQIGGDLVEVVTLVGPNGDAHVYQPTPQDARNVAIADVVLVNGLGFEGWLNRLIAASGFKGAPVVASRGIVVRQMDDDHGHGGHSHGAAAKKKINDPHAWNSAARAQVYARNIGDALVAARPAHAAALRASTDAYIARLKALDQFARDELGAIPKAQRRAITSHDAFGYLEAEYGVVFIAPVGLSTEAEASAQDVARLIRQIKREKIRAVFVENISDQRLVRRIAEEAGAVVGGNLYSDALSGKDGPAATYEAMMRHNVATLKAGLLGQ